jgi:methylenetetrahydrofolate dehydrogenase (NADP+) / methenyltetrahydrofolate cyclohydrolase
MNGRRETGVLIDCHAISNKLDLETERAAQQFRRGGIEPRLCQVIATENEGALSYAKTIRKKAESLGIQHEELCFEKSASTTEIVSRIACLNSRQDIHGIVLGIPTFVHVDTDEILKIIDGTKDVDGLGCSNTFFYKRIASIWALHQQLR